MWWGNTETLLHITGLAKKPMETGQTTHLSWQTTYEWTRCATRKKFLFVRYISWFYLCLWVTFYITCQFYYNFIINRQGNERIISASTENIFLQIVKSYRKNLSCILFLLRNFLWRIIWRDKDCDVTVTAVFFFFNLYLPKLPSSWRAQSLMYSEFSWKSFVRYIL